MKTIQYIYAIVVLVIIAYAVYTFLSAYARFTRLKQEGQCVLGIAVKDNKVGTSFVYTVNGKEYSNIGDGTYESVGRKYIVIFDTKEPENSQMLFEIELSGKKDCNDFNLDSLRRAVSYWDMH